MVHSHEIIFCTDSNNCCPAKEACFRYRELMENKHLPAANLFKTACTKDNKYQLYIRSEKDMKINRIKDINVLFDVVDKCKGAVRVISPEGDSIVLNSQLCRFVLTALVNSGDMILDSLELQCENPEDVALFIQYMMDGGIND